MHLCEFTEECQNKTWNSCCFCNIVACDQHSHYVDEQEDVGRIGGIYKRYVCNDCYEVCMIVRENRHNVSTNY